MNNYIIFFASFPPTKKGARKKENFLLSIIFATFLYYHISTFKGASKVQFSNYHRIGIKFILALLVFLTYLFVYLIKYIIY